MGNDAIRRSLTLVAAGGMLLCGATARAQSLGHRVPGTLGLHAGDQSPSGVYVVGQVVDYASRNNFDRSGARVPADGFALDALAGAIGASATIQLPHGGPYVSMALGLPVGHVSSRGDVTQSFVDRQGVGDLYAQPIRLGAKLPYVDLSVSYGLYLPTGYYDPDGRRGFGNGQVTHEFSAGGTLFCDRERHVFVSALGSYDVNGPKRNIDITRGAMLQVQGGLGVRFVRDLDIGLAGYALWQVSDDSGSALPQTLRGAREEVYGAGPEIDLAIPSLHAMLSARYEHDVAARTRPLGELLFVSLAWRAWDFGQRIPGASTGAMGLTF